MSLANLFDPPNPKQVEGKSALDFISFANMDSHLRIVAQISKVFGVQLYVPILDPVNPNGFEEWLGLHQSTHNQMNVFLQINGQDFSTLDTKNQDQINSWVFLHATEHRQAENELRIG